MLAMNKINKIFVSEFGENDYFPHYFVVLTQQPTASMIRFWKFSVKNLFDLYIHLL